MRTNEPNGRNDAPSENSRNSEPRDVCFHIGVTVFIATSILWRDGPHRHLKERTAESTGRRGSGLYRLASLRRTTRARRRRSVRR